MPPVLADSCDLTAKFSAAFPLIVPEDNIHFLPKYKVFEILSWVIWQDYNAFKFRPIDIPAVVQELAHRHANILPG